MVSAPVAAGEILLVYWEEIFHINSFFCFQAAKMEPKSHEAFLHLGLQYTTGTDKVWAMHIKE